MSVSFFNEVVSFLNNTLKEKSRSFQSKYTNISVRISRKKENNYISKPEQTKNY